MNAGEKGIRAAIYTLIQGLQNNDMRLVEQVYAHTPNLLVFLEGPNMKLVGWKAMRKAVAGFLRAHTGIRSHLNKDCRFVVSGQLGAFYGTYRFEAVNRKSGKRIRWTARNTFLFKRLAKRWKVIHEHDSFPVRLPSS